MRCHHHDEPRRVVAEQFSEQRHPVHAGHLVICQHEIEILLARQLQPMLAALRRGHLIAVVFEDDGVDFSLVALVVYNQNLLSWHSLFSCRIVTSDKALSLQISPALTGAVFLDTCHLSLSSAAGSVTVKMVPRSTWLTTAILP